MYKENLNHIVEVALTQEPEFNLPADFSQNIMAKVILREQWKTDLYEYLNIAGILGFLIAVVSGTYYLVDKDLLLQMYSYVSMNLLQVSAVIFLLNFILFADRVLLRLLFNKWSRS